MKSKHNPEHTATLDTDHNNRFRYYGKNEANYVLHYESTHELTTLGKWRVIKAGELLENGELPQIWRVTSNLES